MKKKPLILLLLLAFLTGCQTPEPPQTLEPSVEPEQLLEASEEPQAAAGEPIDMFGYTSMTPPNLELISVSEPDEVGFRLITGASGAIESVTIGIPIAGVAVAALEVGTEACNSINPDGSFEAEIYAPEGVTLYVAPIYGDDKVFGGDAESEGGLCAHRDHWDGVFIQTDKGDVEHFSTFGALPGGISKVDEVIGVATLRENYWKAEGDFESLSLIIRGVNSSACVRPALKIERLFDAEGNPRAVYDTTAQGTVMTPTGYAIESVMFYRDTDLHYLETGCLRGSSDYDLSYEFADIREGLQEGWYRLRVVPGGWISVQNKGDYGNIFDFQAGSPFYSQEFEPANDQGLLGPVFSVGEPEMPYIPWVLFAETASPASGGARGIVPTELRDDFSFDARVTFPNPIMILPRTDPFSNLGLRYHLEPWLPSISGAPFAHFLPATPLVPFQLPGGEIQANIETPDGRIVSLEEAQFAQSVVARAKVGQGHYYPRMGGNHSFAGPNRTFGLTTGIEDYIYFFEDYGRYQITLNGFIEDIWGNTYRGGGTYEVWVANALNMELGVFQGTPMMEGDAYTPSVKVQPGVPAEIEFNIYYYPNSDPSREQIFTYSGEANNYGYFYPEQLPVVFEEPGEYRYEVVARYIDSEGELWMASRSGASVVAQKEPVITMHGDSFEGRRWYFNNVLFGGCGEESCGEEVCGDTNCGGPNGNRFPRFMGDVVWFADTTNQTRPFMLINDPTGVTGINPFGYSPRPVHSWAESGADVYQYPDEATGLEYWYESVQRPGNSVQARVLEYDALHAHWYTIDNYNQQFGVPEDGDRPNDIKLLFGGFVHRGLGENIYSYYAAMQVIIPELTELGQRTCPPFQGAAGGPANCGPLLTLNGQEVDLFITPTSVRPGSVLEVGDTFAFSGQMWPTLDSKFLIEVTKPDGSLVAWEGQASPIGYVSSEGRNFIADQPGVYKVHVTLVHDTIVPSTGQAPNPPIVADGETVLTEHGYEMPLSAILGSSDSTFDVYVVDPASPVLEITRDSSGLLLTAEVPDGTAVYYTVHMPGFLLGESSAEFLEGTAKINLGLGSISQVNPNFDSRDSAFDVSFLIDAPGNQMAGSIASLDSRGLFSILR